MVCLLHNVHSGRFRVQVAVPFVTIYLQGTLDLPLELGPQRYLFPLRLQAHTVAELALKYLACRDDTLGRHAGCSVALLTC